MSARVLSVNVGQPKVINVGSRTFTTAFDKRPVSGRRHVGSTNIQGDKQADLTAHGGLDKAVYAYSAEDLEWWGKRLDRVLTPGHFAENLTIQGIDLRETVIGEQWRIGTVTLQVSQPRVPCYKMALRFEDSSMPRQFAAAGRSGAYFRVLAEGEIGAGDVITVTKRPSHGITVGLVTTAYHHDHTLAATVLEAEELPEGWRRWAEDMRLIRER
jgi:MOSC domain-containing protein YiiM